MGIRCKWCVRNAADGLQNQCSQLRTIGKIAVARSCRGFNSRPRGLEAAHAGEDVYDRFRRQPRIAVLPMCSRIREATKPGCAATAHSPAETGPATRIVQERLQSELRRVSSPGLLRRSSWRWDELSERAHVRAEGLNRIVVPADHDQGSGAELPCAFRHRQSNLTADDVPRTARRRRRESRPAVGGSSAAAPADRSRRPSNSPRTGTRGHGRSNGYTSCRPAATVAAVWLAGHVISGRGGTRIQPAHRMKLDNGRALFAVVGERVPHVRRHNDGRAWREFLHPVVERVVEFARDPDVGLFARVMVQNGGRAGLEITDRKRAGGSHDGPNANTRRQVDGGDFGHQPHRDAVG